jgi:hypothetical protein
MGSSAWLVLETLAAQHRAALGRFEGNRCFGAALRAGGSRFGPGAAPARRTLGLAGFASFRVVLELFIVKEQLLPGCENKITSAIRTLQNLVDVVHPAYLAPPQTRMVNGSGQRLGRL